MMMMMMMMMMMTTKMRIEIIPWSESRNEGRQGTAVDPAWPELAFRSSYIRRRRPGWWRPSWVSWSRTARPCLSSRLATPAQSVTVDSLTVSGAQNKNDALPQLYRLLNTQLVQHIQKNIIKKWKKRSEETQTLRAGCSKAEPKKIRPAADPLPGGAGRPKFNQLLEMVTTFTYKPSLVKIDERNFELSW